MTEQFNLLAENEKTTVAEKYTPIEIDKSEYLSEAKLEDKFIKQLVSNGYTYAHINCIEDLKANLRIKIEHLNNVEFNNNEWNQFFDEHIGAKSATIEDKARTIQIDHVKSFRFDDGKERNIYLIDKANIHRNELEVINQYSNKGGTHDNRYDVTILVNGFPLVHVELKAPGVDLHEAFNQIERYQKTSFWAEGGLYEYVQIFVISNGTYTKYYSNTTRWNPVSEQKSEDAKQHSKHTSNSFESTSYWADANNNTIINLADFTATFFSRHTLLNILTKYCVFTEEKNLLVMRPYQIVACERIINRVECAHNSKDYGKKEAGGFIWHTTGSGKTLTSFKAAQLATQLEYIDKVIFVVDRKDLDYQTMKEYDRFEKGAADGNSSTYVLAKNINDSSKRILVTTIQKLSIYVKKNPKSAIYDKEVIIIFDECHRSQFGDMHKEIVKRFKKYYLFGFTGTPIFPANLTGMSSVGTTEGIFGKRLHQYTIVDAIRDHNVLPFRIYYHSTFKEKENIKDEQVFDIDREKALCSPERIRKITSYIFDHFGDQTHRTNCYSVKGKNGEKEYRFGYNSILAVQSIPVAKVYYNAFRQENQNRPESEKLKVATIFSYAPNEDTSAISNMSMPEENSESTEMLDTSSREFLDLAIKDYNEMFHTEYDSSTEKFQNYYKDLSQRMKNREIDLLIVVNMFLTGFDAKTLNTLWVDKNLRYHGLIQAFSRTNRILNEDKTHGNIVCFRNLEEATNRALSLFGDKDAYGVTILRSFRDYFFGYYDEKKKEQIPGYNDLVALLRKNFPSRENLHEMEKEDKKEFVLLFNRIVRLVNLLSNFDEFKDQNPLPDGEFQDYKSHYITIWREFHPKTGDEQRDIVPDLVFEIELIKTTEVTVRHILELVEQYKEQNEGNEEVKASIVRSIDSSPSLRDKKELIMAFINSLTPDADVEKQWHDYVEKEKKAEFTELVKAEDLNEKAALKYIRNCFTKGYISEWGTEFDDILPHGDPFGESSSDDENSTRIAQKLQDFFTKYYAIASSEF